MTQLIVRGEQTIAGKSYSDGDVFDASNASPSDVRKLRREHVVMDVTEYALATSREKALAMSLPAGNPLMQALNAVHSAEAHLFAMREQWLDLDPMARQVFEKYDALQAQPAE